MKSLSQSEYGELRSLYEQVYSPKTILEGFTDEDLDLTDEEIEEQVEEVFLECIEEGYDIDDVERIICEAIDSELHMLSERVDPKETQRRRDQAKDRLATGRAMKSAAAKSSASDSSDNKASTLSRVKGAAKKVASGLKTGAKAAGKAVQGGVGVASRAVGTAQRAASAVKGAAKKGYERGRYGAGGSSSGSSSSSSSGASSSSSSAGGSSDSDSGSSSSGSSAAPRKRKDGLLKRGLKKLVRGAAKAVSTGAGAVKAGADYVASRARKEELEATGLFSDSEIEAIMEAEVNEGMKPYPAEKVARKREAVKKKEDIHIARGEYDQADKQYKRGVSLAMKTKMKKEEVEAVDEAMSSYDRNRKRAAQRAAARNAARDAGQTGAVPGVGYVTPRRERETYVDSAGTTRHKSGAKMPKD